MTRWRAHWDFPYEPVTSAVAWRGALRDVVIATIAPVPPASLSAALADLVGTVEIRSLVDEAPLHWFLATSTMDTTTREVRDRLERAGIGVRYVAPARIGEASLAPPLDLDGVPPAEPRDWRVPPPGEAHEPSREAGGWFLGPAGVHVDRASGTGHGVRVAVIDDDIADVEQLALDRLVLVGVDSPAAASGHAALVVAWAVGARGFSGVAPDASPRLYCIPKPGSDVLSFPLALVQAVRDGADVVVCATYLESTTSPMLDDALEIASRLGRGGRGTVVVLPTGRETSSPGLSLHASLSLSLSDPASDPRVHCVGPSGRGGGWFMWRDAKGRLRPFANRGPAVRWLAPGDDLGDPFGARSRLTHAESSGASAVAAGVMALVLAGNPELEAPDLHALLAKTSVTPPSEAWDRSALADPADVLPDGRDRDGHDAKCGYGRLSAVAAVLAASDPFALALLAIGEEAAARRWMDSGARPYSAELGRWAARFLLRRPDLEHSIRAIARHARLVAHSPARTRSHGRGAIARQMGLFVRGLIACGTPPAPIRRELSTLLSALGRSSDASSVDAGDLDAVSAQLFRELWPPASSSVPGMAAAE